MATIITNVSCLSGQLRCDGSGTPLCGGSGSSAVAALSSGASSGTGCDGPTMRCKISAPDADLPMQWCGFTWVKSAGGGGPATLGQNERRSGQWAIVCGVCDGSCTTGATTLYTVTACYQSWRPVTGSGLDLARRYVRYSYSAFGYDRGFNRLYINGVRPGTPADISAKDAALFYDVSLTGGPCPPWTATSFGLSQIGKVGTAALPCPPTVNDWTLRDEFFGNYTNGNVTFTWHRYEGWEQCQHGPGPYP